MTGKKRLERNCAIGLRAAHIVKRNLDGVRRFFRLRENMTAKVLALVGDLDGPALWRVLLPFSELQRQGFSGVEWDMWDNDFLANIVHRFDAVILPRKFWKPKDYQPAARWFKALHKAGIAVIYEMDDDMVSEDFVKRIMYKDGYGIQYARRRMKWIRNVIQTCDGVTVSSQRLATMVRGVTDKPVRVVPNYIDLDWFWQIQSMNERKVEGLTIGWAGGARPDDDILPMVEAWKRIAARYPDVKFVVQGHHAKVFYDSLPLDRIAPLEWLPIDGYPAGLLNIDIGCCPLSDTKFNRAKTYIKAMEYAASGAAVVASPTVYNQIIEHGADGYIATTADDWERHLTALVESESQRKTIAMALLDKIKREHTLKTEAWRWVEAWGDIVTDFRQRQKRPHIYLPEGVQYAIQ